MSTSVAASTLARASGGGDATGSEDGYVKGFEQALEKWESPDFSRVATGLGALGHDQVDPGFDGGDGSGQVLGLGGYDDAGVVQRPT